MAAAAKFLPEIAYPRCPGQGSARRQRRMWRGLDEMASSYRRRTTTLLHRLGFIHAGNMAARPRHAR